MRGLALTKTAVEHGGTPAGAAADSAACRLGDGSAREVLDFLARRPAHTICMAGLIRDNGLDSPFNRGSFYGCRDALGRLTGVALFGHQTLLEARDESAVAAFARHACSSPPSYMVMGECDVVRSFWSLYSGGEVSPRRTCQLELLEKPLPTGPCATPGRLRAARPAEVDLVVEVNALIITQEHGLNPLEHDAEAFRARVARRVSKGRVLVDAAEGRLLFKAEVVAETRETTFVEGIYLTPELRGTECGGNYMRALEAYLHGRTNSLCGLVSDADARAGAFYRKAGYTPRAHFETIFVG